MHFCYLKTKEFLDGMNYQQSEYVFTIFSLDPPQKSLRFLVSVCVASDLYVGIFGFSAFFFFCYETRSNCSQNCWIDWNSAVLCFKQVFPHRGMNVCPICAAPLLATILCVWEIGSVQITSSACVTYFTGWNKTKKIGPAKNKKNK